MLALLPSAVRRRPVAFIALAVSSSQAKRGRRAGRQAARMPTLSSMLSKISTSAISEDLQRALLAPYLECVAAIQVLRRAHIWRIWDLQEWVRICEET